LLFSVLKELWTYEVIKAMKYRHCIMKYTVYDVHFDPHFEFILKLEVVGSSVTFTLFE